MTSTRCLADALTGYFVGLFQAAPTPNLRLLTSFELLESDEEALDPTRVVAGPKVAKPSKRGSLLVTAEMSYSVSPAWVSSKAPITRKCKFAIALYAFLS